MIVEAAVVVGAACVVGQVVRSHGQSRSARHLNGMNSQQPNQRYFGMGSPRRVPPPAPQYQGGQYAAPAGPPPAYGRNNPKPKEILFYHRHQPHFGFTNFSPDPVQYKGKMYPTSEHLFQAMKFLEHRPDIAEYIRTDCFTSRDAFNTARHYKNDVRADWLNINIAMMDEVVFAKFTQHRDLCLELLETGDDILIEDSDVDSFWGWGADHKGRNELGKALMRLRTQLKEHPPFDFPGSGSGSK
jgi:ribA/ribD-fused uncharacterized protein